jgi:23S rRNA A2030 N6-methylase RlmJ
MRTYVLISANPLRLRGPRPASTLLVLCLLAALVSSSAAENKILGEIQIVGPTKTEQTAGVWADGQYLGYVEELKGSKQILLLPGEHEIIVRQAGYKDFVQTITLQPNDKKVIEVSLERDPRFQMPSVTAEIKLSVDPDRAAVFVDGVFLGHAGEFDGVGKALLVAPGKRKITILLPGYKTFETQISLAANQKFKLKTTLVKAAMLESSTPPAQ